METFQPQRTVYTVSDVSGRIKELIERQFTDVWVEGEVSNLRSSAVGHIYFTLKDDRSQLPAVCFRNAAMYLRFKPENGKSFRVRGRVTTYEVRGEYQIIVEVLEPVGVGALQQAFDRLKAKLDAEGLFAAERKRPLPPFPSRVGIVTSPKSAAIRDILSVLRRRHDAIDVLIYPTDVQGDAASRQIAAGIDHLGLEPGIDVIIVTRGGGSLEDLWPFNEERVARAIARSERPVISAVGHEVDFTISDLVADLRAPTPSAAAEIVTSRKDEVVERLERGEARMSAALKYRLSELRRFLATKVGGRGFVVAENRIRQLAQRVDDCGFRLEQLGRSGQFVAGPSHRLQLNDRAMSEGMTRTLMALRGRFSGLTQTLDALSPLSVLERGYAVCRTSAGIVVRRSAQVAVDTEVDILLHEGGLTARVTAVKSRAEE